MATKEESRQEILEKIQKVLNLTTSPNQGEAEAAARMATKLLLKYNLTEEEVSRNSTNHTMVEVEASSHPTIVRDWISWLSTTIGRHTFTKVYYRKGATLDYQKKRFVNMHIFVFYGKEQNAKTAAYMFDQMYSIFLALAESYISEYCSYFSSVYGKDPFRTKGLGSEHPNAKRSSYLLGLVIGLGESLQKDRAAADNTSMALIRILDQEVETAWIERSKEFGKRKDSKKSVNSRDYEAGKADGRKISIKPGLES